ncbi:O-antigen ligase family protein [Paenibacillus dendritiformis]|uniref:O-antigen polymerase n=1 Tax=Paenibacillus dendritiformis C454 TaxID=1131935 RepID=H3S9N0_9BACL|nr:O-antigen ligase family protein [Paenibacillus dendritiformis]EHQ64148.1 O-antigen polymerase [Paenibacillus dendritiformis C454]CAH8767337.1 O-antigen ligase family protein [Paenibacillus dendritiformis]
MSTYGYGAKKSKQKNDKIPLYRGGISIFLILFLLWAPFQFGLFNGQSAYFEKPIYWSILIASILSFFTIGFLLQFKNRSNQIDFLSLIVFLLPISYGVSSLFATSSYLAVNAIFIMFAYAVFFALSYYILNDGKLNRYIQSTLTGAAYATVWFGLMNWLGNGKFAAALIGWFSQINSEGLYHQAIWVDANGPRLASVFQYPNTYVAYLMAFLFIAVFYLTTPRNTFSHAVHGFMLVPIILSIFLTLSRSGLVLLPVVFIVVLLFINPARQILWIVHLAISSVATLVILNIVSDIGIKVHLNESGSSSLKGWLYIIGASAACAVLCWIVQRFFAPWLERKLEGFSMKKWANAILPVGGTIIAGVLLIFLLGTGLKNLLPESISSRLSSINFQQHSVLERITFYKDSMKLVADYPVFGAGGGAWSALYEKYQNNPYESAQAHSYYMQYLVETGFLGFIILIAFLGIVYWKYVQSFRNAEETKRNSYFMYFILATSILVHSVMDFNMSYVYIGIIVFISLGGMAASISTDPLKKIKPSTFKTAAAIIYGIAGIIMFITSLLFIQASSSYAKARAVLNETSNFNQTMDYLNKALKIRGTVPEYAELKAALFQQVYAQQGDEAFFAEAEHTLQQALEKQPGNRLLLLRLIELYKQKGMDSELYKVYSENAEGFPWDMEWYDKYMDATLRQGMIVYNESPEKKNEYMDEIIEALRHVEQGVEHLKTLPEGQLQGREFKVTSSMAMNAGRAYIMKGEPGQGAEAMKPYLNEDLSNAANRKLARWYVGATIQNGQVDQTWYDKLISVDPEEKEKVEQVAGMRFLK